MKLRHFIILCMLGWNYSAYAEEKSLPIDDPDALLAVINHNPDVIRTQLIGWNFEFDLAGGSYQTVLSHIKRGNEKWLKVADALSCCVDAASGEELRMAEAIAFTHTPETVLHHWPSYSLNTFCSVPLMEPTKVEFDNYVTSVKSAIKRIKDLALQEKKAECSKIIDTVHWSEP